MGAASARASGSFEHGRGRVCHAVRTGSLILSLVLSVRVVGVRKRTTPPRVLVDANCFIFFHGGVQVAFDNKSTATAVQVKFLASKCDQKRAGCTIKRTRLEKKTEKGGALMGAFEALLELLKVYPLLWK